MLQTNTYMTVGKTTRMLHEQEWKINHEQKNESKQNRLLKMKRGRPKPSMCENQPVFIEAPTSSNKTVSSKPLRKTQHFLFFLLCQLQEFVNVSAVN